MVSHAERGMWAWCRQTLTHRLTQIPLISLCLIKTYSFLVPKQMHRDFWGGESSIYSACNYVLLSFESRRLVKRSHFCACVCTYRLVLCGCDTLTGVINPKNMQLNTIKSRYSEPAFNKNEITGS